MAPKASAAGPGRALRWAEHKEKTRRDLLAAARTLFAERGYRATGVADIAAAAGVTERTLFRYFPSKLALALDEAVARLPEMARLIRERPAGEPPYQAACEGILGFAERHRDILLVIAGSQDAPGLPPQGRQRPLIDFEGTLAAALRERYAVPPEDQVAPAVWARASLGALRTALTVTMRSHPAGTPPAPRVFAGTLRACFEALAGGQ